MSPTAEPSDPESGAAVVEFVLVLGLLLFVFVGVVVIAVLFHGRDVITADAAEGARYEANLGAEQGSGGRHATALVDATLGTAFRDGITCVTTSAAGDATVAVTCSGDVTLPYSPVSVHFSRTAHALREERP